VSAALVAAVVAVPLMLVGAVLDYFEARDE